MRMQFPLSRFTLIPYINQIVSTCTGLEYVPRDKPFILAGNHISFFDGVVLTTKLFGHCKHSIRFISNTGVLHPSLRPLIQRWTKVIYKDKTKPALCLTPATKLLRRGIPIGIFPEGLRVPRGNQLSRGKTGAIRLSLATQLPIIPVGIISTGEPHQIHITKQTQPLVSGFLDKKNRILTTAHTLVDPYNHTHHKELSATEMHILHEHIYSTLGDGYEHYFKHNNTIALHFGKPLSLQSHNNTPLSYSLLRSLTNELMLTISQLCNRSYEYTK